MKNKTKAKSTSQAQVRSAAVIGEKCLSHFPLAVGLLFAGVGWGLFSAFEYEYLFRVQELSLWLPTKVYFDDRMLVPGGLMTYLACFLTQFF